MLAVPFDHLLICLLPQALDPDHMTAAAARVGAYPPLRTDMSDPQVRPDLDDDEVLRIFDDNERITKKVHKFLKEKKLFTTIEKHGLLNMFALPQVWSNAPGGRRCRIRHVRIDPAITGRCRTVGEFVRVHPLVAPISRK